MSNVATVHDVIKYEAGKTKALAGQRLSKHTYKTDKETGVKRDSMAVSLPIVTQAMVLEAAEKLAPIVADYLMSVQDKIVKSMLDSTESVEVVSDTEISIDACISYLEESNESGRLTKEGIGAWFDASVADVLMLTLAEKLGVGEVPSDAEIKRIEAMVAAFKEKTMGLAGGKTRYDTKTAESVKKCMLLVEGEETGLAEKFVKKLDRMIELNAVDTVDILSAL